MKHKRKPKKNFKTIDNIVTMQDLALELNSSVNDIITGYLRQPISHDLVIGKQYIIHGTCALNQENCSYMVTPLSKKYCKDCEIYKERFNENRGH